MASKTIEIKEFGIIIELGSGDFSSTGAWAGGAISSDMKEVCPHCHRFSNCYFSCDQFGDNEEAEDRKEYNSMMEALESMILAHAISGIDVASEKYVDGIRTACQSCAKATE